MKLQLYPIYSENIGDISPVLELDPLTQKIDLFFKKPIDNQNIKSYNNYNKTKTKHN